MSIWEFVACVDGYGRANGAKKKNQADVSDDEFDAMGIGKVIDGQQN